MKGDFSNSPDGLDADTDWQSVSALWLQQGRPMLDVDANRAMALHRHQLTDALATLIGPAAGPADDLGFGVSPEGALVLNESADGRHVLWVPPRVERTREGALDVAATLVKAGGAEDLVVTVSMGDRPTTDPTPIAPQTWHCRLWIPAGTSGPLVVRPGHYGVLLAADRSVQLRQAGVREPRLLGQWPVEAWCDLVLAEDGDRLRIRIGDQAAITVAQGPRPAGADAGVVIAAQSPQAVAPDGGPLLRCRLAVLKAWPAFMDPATVPTSTAAPSFDLLTTRIAEDGAGRGHMDSGARPQTRHQPATSAQLAWSGTPPRLMLERFHLSAGRYFVEGIGCRNRADLLSDAQPFLPDAAAARPAGAGNHLVYLEVFDQAVDALDDPSLADEARGGADTVIRQQTVWQVLTRPCDSTGSAAELQALLTGPPHGRLALRRTPSAAPRQGAGVLRVEIHHPGWTFSQVLQEDQRQALRWGTVLDAEARIVAMPAGEPALPAASPVRLCLVPDGEALLTQVTHAPAADQYEFAQLPPGARRGARIGLLPVASFKWSRDNAAVSVPVAHLQPAVDDNGQPAAVALLASAGLNGMGARHGDWMEWVDPDEDLMGRPGPFLRVLSSEADTLQITLQGWLGPLPFSPPAGSRPHRLRLWSHRRHWHVPADRDAPPDDGPWPRAATATELEIDAGLHVRFAPEGWHCRGDYWMSPLREDDGDAFTTVHQPAPPALAAQGPRHHRTPLAMLNVSDRQIQATDLRRSFSPLGSVGERDAQAGPMVAQFVAWAKRWGVEAPALSEAPAAWLERLSGAAPRGHPAGFQGDLARGPQAWKPSAPHSAESPEEVAQGTTAFVSSRCVATASWQRLHPTGNGETPAQEPHWPVGAGQGLMIDAMGFFLGADGRLSAANAPFKRWRHVEHVGPVMGAALTQHAGCLLLVGGHSPGTERLHGHVWRLHPVGMVLERVGTLCVPVTGAAAVVLRDRLFVMGGVGSGGRPVATVQSLPLAAAPPRWFAARGTRSRLCSPLPQARAELAAAAWGASALVAGGIGEDGQPLAGTMLLNPALGTFIPRAALPQPVGRAGSALLPEGLVLAGGIGPGGRASSEVWLYRPLRNRWQALASLPRPSTGVALMAEPETFAAEGTHLIAVGGAGPHGDCHDAHALAVVRALTAWPPQPSSSTP